MPTLIAVIILVVLLVIVVGSLALVYNKLVRQRVQSKNAWSQIDVQLKRRHDLIPNLVETVKGYASHERETLEGVTKARQQAVDLQGQGARAADQAQAENMLSGALRQLFALSENYPDLKANQNFMQLQEELVSTENKIGFARQHYNDTVSRYNTTVQSFPSNMIANMFNFEERDFFEVELAEQREAPEVKF